MPPSRHTKIDDGVLGGVVLGESHGLVDGSGGADLEAAVAQGAAETLAEGLVVVDEQHGASLELRGDGGGEIRISIGHGGVPPGPACSPDAPVGIRVRTKSRREN